jgi:putative membrane protein
MDEEDLQMAIPEAKQEEPSAILETHEPILAPLGPEESDRSRVAAERLRRRRCRIVHVAAPFLDEGSKNALVDAVKAIEKGSSVEVVIAVKAKSAPHLHTDLIVGFIVAYATLGFMLFSPWPFGVTWIFVDPLIAGAAVALLLAEFPSIRRGLTPLGVRRQAVKAAAHSAFVEKGVGLTRNHTGLLIYISQLERLVEVVADQGIRRAVDQALWDKAVAALHAAVARGEDGRAIARHVRELGQLLATALPGRPDDINEIPDDLVES